MSQSATTTPTTTPCLEIAVYDVHTSALDEFPAQQVAVHDALRAVPGFIASERLQGLSTPTLFADYITWASRESAEAAAAQMAVMPVAAGFMASIRTMRTFAHLPVQPSTSGEGGL